jgi:hypothetical protein
MDPSTPELFIGSTKRSEGDLSLCTRIFLPNEVPE